MKRYTYYMLIISLIMIGTGLFLITPNNEMKTVDTSVMTKSLKSNVINTVSIKKELQKKRLAKKRAEQKKIQTRMASNSNLNCSISLL